MVYTPDTHINYDLFAKSVYTFATLPPAANSQGEIVWISDLAANPSVAAGATATGGGNNFGKVRCDGTVWKIVTQAGTS